MLGAILGGNATKKAAKQNMALLGQAKTEGLGYINAGSNEAKGYLGGIGDLYSNLATESGGLSGLGMYANALGLNGAEGNAAAQGAFQAGPGYEWQLGQGLQALERRAAAQGRLQSGQTGIDTMTYGQGLANQEYGNWLNNLKGYGDTQAGIYTGALGGQAGSLSGLANLATNTSGQKVDLLTGITSGLMGANNQKAAGTGQMWGGVDKLIGGGLGMLGYL